MLQHYEAQAFTYLGVACAIPALVIFYQMKNVGASLLMFGYCAAVFILCGRVAALMHEWADQDLLIGVGLANLVVAIQIWRSYRRS
jgi:hypothetical protein